MEDGAPINGNEQCYRKSIGISKLRLQFAFQPSSIKMSTSPNIEIKKEKGYHGRPRGARGDTGGRIRGSSSRHRPDEWIFSKWRHMMGGRLCNWGFPNFHYKNNFISQQ